MAKINISIDDELLKRVDNTADKSYLSRSALFTIATTQYLAQQEILVAINDISSSMRKIADTGIIDDETMSHLNDLQKLVDLYVNK